MSLHLITGGLGFIGQAIARQLLERGEKVRIIDLIEDKYERLSDCEIVRGNILDRDILKKSLKKVDFVHHTAALVPIKKDKAGFWKTNFEGTRLVYQAAEEAGVSHFSYMSSSAIWGQVSSSDCPLTVNTPMKPCDSYGCSKAAADEFIGKASKKNSHMTASIIRPRTTIGPGRLGIFSILFEWIKENRKVYIIGDGSNLLQLAHVKDVAEISIRSALMKKSGIFNVGTDRYCTLREDLEKLCFDAESTSKVVGLPVWLASSMLRMLDVLKLSPLAAWHYLTYHIDYYCDISLTCHELDWMPKYSNQEMLIESYNWYIQNKTTIAEIDENLSPHQLKLKQGFLFLLKKLS